jgi:hypothetical protein
MAEPGPQLRSGQKPTVLIAATSRWIPTARLAMALSQAGCVIDAVCPAGHPVEKIGGVRKTYAYRSLFAMQSFAAAITAAQPDLIVPGDDLATRHLHHLHLREGKRRSSAQPTCGLIERSLGAAESFPRVYARTAFIELARQAGVRAPKTEVIADLDQLRGWTQRSGFPTVLKANGTSGGDGVRVVHNAEEAAGAFRQLQAPPSWLRAAKRALVDQDRTLIAPAVLRQRFLVNAQEFAAGREATSAVACWQGEILAGLHFEVLNKRDAEGPSSVLRAIENADMAAAAETMVRELKLSGLHGFDFMLESSTGKAFLIEINPRATQVGHLTLGEGRDLPAALYAALTGNAIHPAPPITENRVIALFPQEWMRDPESAFLQSGYHDVPWEEPALVRESVRKKWKLNRQYSQEHLMQALATVRVPRHP